MAWPDDYASALADQPTQTAQDKFGRIADAFTAGLKNTIETPGRAMQNGITTDQAVDWAAPMAMGMVAGGRLPGGAPEGALGSSGAKLAQPEGIRAYHGSPYDFDRFDLSKIGTGEGAQAYGHGLYFAENEGVAKSYKTAGMRSSNIQFEGQGLSNIRDARYAELPVVTRQAVDWLKAYQDVPKAIADAKYSNIPGLQAELMRLQESGSLSTLPPGRMYEVNIGAKPEQFLDWDKPLSQQSEPARRALNDIWGLPSPESQTTMTGSDVYRTLASARGGERQMAGGQYSVPYTNEPRVTAEMREAGIPGIRYLDQGSRLPTSDFTVWAPKIGGDKQFVVRGPGNVTHSKFNTREEANVFADRENAKLNPQTHNYVVFDPGIIDILRKYGLAGLTAAGGANYAAGLQDSR